MPKPKVHLFKKIEEFAAKINNTWKFIEKFLVNWNLNFQIARIIYVKKRVFTVSELQFSIHNVPGEEIFPITENIIVCGLEAIAQGKFTQTGITF